MILGNDRRANSLTVMGLKNTPVQLMINKILSLFFDLSDSCQPLKNRMCSRMVCYDLRALYLSAITVFCINIVDVFDVLNKQSNHFNISIFSCHMKWGHWHVMALHECGV